MDEYVSQLKQSVKKFINNDIPTKIQFMEIGGKRNAPVEELTADGYILVDTITEPIYKDQSKFQYKINAQGFRSQHFKELNSEDVSILYAGCSMTYGVGLPVEYTWPYLTSSFIQNKHDKNVESFNVASPGASIHEVVRNCFIFFEKYGNPNFLFMSIPDIERSIGFDNADEKFKQIIPSEFNLTQKMSKQLIYALSSINTSNNWLLYSDIIFMLESYCKAAGIKLIWTSWVKDQSEDWDNLIFKNYLKTEDLKKATWYAPINGQSAPDNFPDNVDNLPYWGYARDGAHPGLLWSKTLSQKIFNEIERRAWV